MNTTCVVNRPGINIRGLKASPGAAQRVSAHAPVHAGTHAREESVPVATSMRDRAANRAGQYRKAIAELQREGDYPGAMHEAKRWLLSELSRVQRRRPQDSAAVHAEVTEKLAALAEALPFYKPAKRGGHDVSA